MTDRRRAEENGLAPWFEAGRAAAPEPSGDWLARMEAMALDEQPALPCGDPVAGAPGARRDTGGAGFGWLREIWSGLGGWPALAGLAAVCAAGVWIGAASPEELTSWLSVGSATTTLSGLEPASGFDYAMMGQ